jgi:putative transposase
MKYNFMFENKNKFPIEKMAGVLDIKKSGYYKWLKNPVSKREIENDKLLIEIKTIHKESNGNYGSPMIYQALKAKGIKCSKNRVARIMKENNIRSKVKKRFRITTNSKHNFPVAANILDRKFKVSEADKAWVSDITYIWTMEGWLYLCVVIDLYSRKVIGWSMSERIDKSLVIMAFLMAWNNRNPKEGLLFHSDRGVQYASKDFQKLLKKKKVLCSMSRKGNCWDNACSESFFHTLKVEEVYQTTYANRKVARLKIFEYIECYYNNFRMHSYLGYLNPTEFELRKSA